MSNFFDDEQISSDPAPTGQSTPISERLSAFSARPVQRDVNVHEIDQVAHAAGFTSREAPAQAKGPERKTRRVIKKERSVMNTVRVRESQWARFINFADHIQGTYEAALIRLLDESPTVARLEEEGTGHQ
jgi:hypothetical protein